MSQGIDRRAEIDKHGRSAAIVLASANSFAFANFLLEIPQQAVRIGLVIALALNFAALSVLLFSFFVSRTTSLRFENATTDQQRRVAHRWSFWGWFMWFAAITSIALGYLVLVISVLFSDLV